MFRHRRAQTPTSKFNPVLFFWFWVLRIAYLVTLGMLKLFTSSRLVTHLTCSSFLLISRLICVGRSPPAQDQELFAETIQKVNKPEAISQPNKSDFGRANVKSELSFDFMYSYSETSPGVEPIGFREPPRFSPFGPGRIDRKWNGICAPAQEKQDLDMLAEERERVLGDPLSYDEIALLVDRYCHTNCSRQINLGKYNFRFFIFPLSLEFFSGTVVCVTWGVVCTCRKMRSWSFLQAEVPNAYVWWILVGIVIHLAIHEHLFWYLRVIRIFNIT